MILVLGLAAAALTITSFLAQTYKILRTRDTSSLATPMWILSTVAFALWILYGIVLGQWPLIVANAICFALCALILVLKVLPRRERDAVLDKVSSRRTAAS